MIGNKLKFCRICGELLTNENWCISNINNCNYICTKCIVWNANHIKNGIKNVDYVICNICGKQLLSISNHLRTHNITKEEYLKLYPEALLVCDTTKQRLSILRYKNQKRIILKCDNCNIDIERCPSNINDHNFCDNKCRWEYEKKKQYMKIDKINSWVEENTNEHLCKCGCGNFVVISPRHYYDGIPDYISGDNMKTEGSKIAAVIRGKESVQRLIDASKIYWGDEKIVNNGVKK